MKKTTSKNIVSRIFVLVIIFFYINLPVFFIFFSLPQTSFHFIPVWIEEESSRGGEHDDEQWRRRKGGEEEEDAGRTGGRSQRRLGRRRVYK